MKIKDADILAVKCKDLLAKNEALESKLAAKDRQLEAAADDIVGEWIDENGPCDTSEMKQMFRKRWEEMAK